MSDKPREFWINWDTSCPEHEIFTDDDPKYHWGKLTRVIEHSAYEKLLEKCANYEETLRKIARDTSNNQDFYLQHLAKEALGEK